MTKYDPAQPLWSIMTKTHGGRVSFIRDLTLEQAQRAYERLDPWRGYIDESFVVHGDYLPDGCLYSASGGVSRSVSDGDIEEREVFGPPGWEWFENLERWPKIYSIFTDGKGNILPDEYQEHPERAARHRDEQERRKLPDAEKAQDHGGDLSTIHDRERRWWFW